MTAVHYNTEFHAQCGEDKWLAENWAATGLPDTGFFVELGAGDGIFLSNTLWLEQVKEWSGLLIEGDPRNVVKSRPRSIVERCVIGQPGIVSFGLHPTDAYLSGSGRNAIEHVEVQARTLSDVLQQHSIARVDLISIDTEGNELEVWRTLDLSMWRPTIAIIELYTWKMPDRSRELIKAIRDDGYDLLHRTDINGVFKCRAG